MRVQSKDDYCGCCGWKERFKIMWDRLQTSIYGIKVNGTRINPDGDGIVSLTISQDIPIATDRVLGGVKSSSDEGKVSVNPLTGKMTANGLTDALDAIEQAEAEITSLNETVGDDTGGLVKQVSDLEGDVAEIDQDIIDLTNAIDRKQATLVSGTNIKTINGTSVLGAGNIEIQGGGEYTLPVATTDALGGVKSSDADGDVSVSASGTMTVNGYAAIETRLDDIDGTGGSIEQIESEIGALQTSVSGHGSRLDTAESSIQALNSDVTELSGDITTIDGQIDAINTAVSGMQTSIGNLQTGKQNVLNADQIRKITISTADPTGGSDGDIWLRYNA